MNTRRPPSPPNLSLWATACAALFVIIAPLPLQAQGKKKNPASKVYVADLSGDAQIDTGDTIQDLSKRSVYTAQGTVIETKRPEDQNNRAQNFSTMVYSNGTGAFFDSDTRVEVKNFVQEPFTPNRADIETEPSISQTQAFVARGIVGLCNSKLVAGSNMNYQTPHGSVNIRGRKVVIEAGKNVTKISMLEGDSTVRAGVMDMGGHTIQAGEQAIIRYQGQGKPNQIEIQKIPDNEIPDLDEKVAMACMAKKTVYFEVREKKDENTNGPASEGGADAAVTAFDNDDGKTSTTIREIVPVEVVPVDLTKNTPMSASAPVATAPSTPRS